MAFETTEGTWMSVDIAPDGSRLALDLLGDLYLLEIGGGEARAITRGLAFDTQPVYSPDGREILFVSDRSGAENLWSIAVDGGAARQLTFNTDVRMFLSPAWAPDGRTVYATVFRADLASYELCSFDAAGAGEPELLVPVKASADQPRDTWSSAMGAAPSPDGSQLYFAQHIGNLDTEIPGWTVQRMDLASGDTETVIKAVERRGDAGGSFFRPLPSPDGRQLAYASRHRGQTELRLRNLETGEDRLLRYPVQRDQLQATSVQDLLPRFDFTPDGRSLVYTADNRLWRVMLDDGAVTEIPFRAAIELELGAPVYAEIAQETGPVRARLIQAPDVSPDGQRLAFSALGRIYVQELAAGAKPVTLAELPPGQFHPSWSPDGQSVAFVTWTAQEAGQVWVAPVDGNAAPRRVTDRADFYTRPVFTPDGGSIVVLRSSHHDRMHRYMEYGQVRDAALLRIPLDGGEAAGPTMELANDQIGGRPHVLVGTNEVAVNFADGLWAVTLDGALDSGAQRSLVSAKGHGWYFLEGPQRIQELQVSPDGRWVLARSFAQQLHLFPMPAGEGGDVAPTVDLSDPQTTQQQVTRRGADYFGWTDGGRTMTWALGSTWYRCALEPITRETAAGVAGSGPLPDLGCRTPESFEVPVAVPRDTPEGDLVLRGATVLTMNGDEVIEDADLHVRDDRIAAVDARGELEIPADAQILSVDGLYIVPGFIETHIHLADIRRDVIEFASWGAAASLAYGVTTVFDPSSLSIDMLVYEDLVDAGLIVGSRIHSTGPAIFDFHAFASPDEIRDVLLRYRDHYRTRNVKMYRTGNRRVRQWLAMEAAELGMLPTTEGALAMKLGLTQVLDGYMGAEHELAAQPLGHDIVQLMARSGAAYTPTLVISAGPDAEHWFIARDDPANDPKMQRFWPGFARDWKLRHTTWHTFEEYSFPAAAAGAAEILRAGGTVGVGAHGNIPGLGYQWELQALEMGGMTPTEVLRAATVQSARAIGRAAEFGTLEPGKYADLVVLERDPREAIANTLTIRQVMKNGRLYDGDTLDEIWPRQRAFPTPWYAEEDTK